VSEVGSWPPRTAIAIVLDAAAPALAAARAELDEEAAASVPLHVTLLYPFVDRDALGPELVRDLHDFFAARPPLAFALTRVEVFAGEVVYAAPEPAAPLIEVILELAACYPETPPYGGRVSDPVPHATLARLGGSRDDAATIAAVRARVEPLLPVACEVPEAHLLEEFQPDRWRMSEPLPFGAGVAA